MYLCLFGMSLTHMRAHTQLCCCVSFLGAVTNATAAQEKEKEKA